MGLDQYAFATKGEDKIELMYWRKHANLQGWMEELYSSKGGTEVFNCIPVELDEYDLDKLESEFNKLEVATGFFWGSSRPEDDETTADFISKAREYIKKGYTIEYDSWW